MLIVLYNILNILLLPLWLLVIGYRCFTGKEDFVRILERLGWGLRNQHHNSLWIHAASVGESMSVLNLITQLKKIQPELNIVFTSGTVTSAKIIQEKIGSLVTHQYLPLDNYLCMQLFLANWRPKLALFVDSELWPTIITTTAKFCPIISLNSRLSNRSYQRIMRYKLLFLPVLRAISLYLPQSKEDQQKLLSLGMTNVSYIGNLKYCAGNNAQLDVGKLGYLEKQFAGKRVIVAASTHHGEEEWMLKLYDILQEKIPNLLLIIAPRHMARIMEIKDLLSTYRYAQHSTNEPVKLDTQIYLADSLGELAYFYSCAEIALIGNSFCYELGHNPIEAAVCGAVIISGKGYSNFKDLYHDFIEANACIIVNDQVDAANQIADLLDNRQARDILTTHAKNLISQKAEIISKTINKIISYLA